MMALSLLQDLLVYALVAACALYSLWIFLPASWRQRGAAALMARSQRLAGWRFLQRAAQPAGGCGSGCGSCDATSDAPAKAQKVQIYRRR